MFAGRSERLAAIVAFTVFVRVRMTVRGNGFGFKHRTADGTLHAAFTVLGTCRSGDSDPTGGGVFSLRDRLCLRVAALCAAAFAYALCRTCRGGLYRPTGHSQLPPFR